MTGESGDRGHREVAVMLLDDGWHIQGVAGVFKSEEAAEKAREKQVEKKRQEWMEDAADSQEELENFMENAREKFIIDTFTVQELGDGPNVKFK